MKFTQLYVVTWGPWLCRAAEFAAAVGRAHRGQAANGRDAQQRTHGADRLDYGGWNNHVMVTSLW